MEGSRVTRQAAAQINRKGAPEPTKATQPSTPAKAPSATIVMLKQLAPELAEAQALTRKQTEALLAGLVEMVTAPQRGRQDPADRARHHSGADRPAWTGRNPGTGQPIEIKASRKIAFSAAKELLDVV